MNDFAMQFECFAGTKRYVKFVETLRGQSRAEERLMFWQERLLADFAESTGLPQPMTFGDVLAMYATPTISVDLGLAPDQFQIVEQRVFREFQSKNQHKAGAHHVTVFGVEISPQPHSRSCTLVDGAGPHDDPATAAEIMRAFEHGVLSLVAHLGERKECLVGFDMRLLSYVNQEVSLSKYQRAIQFLLHDLLCETRMNRTVPIKMVGIPL